MDRRAVVVRPSEAPVAPGPPTPGMDRRELMNDDRTWVGWVEAAPELAGGWHHHGDRDSYIYVLQGRVAIDFGPGGRERIEALAGDFIFNPARMVHREVTFSGEPSRFFVVRVGTGPQNVNVDGPDPA